MRTGSANRGRRGRMGNGDKVIGYASCRVDLDHTAERTPNILSGEESEHSWKLKKLRGPLVRFARVDLLLVPRFQEMFMQTYYDPDDLARFGDMKEGSP